MNKYLWDGSYTVEAAFLVPMILGVLYAWMFQLFYLHDQVVMNGMLQEYVMQAQLEGGAGDAQELERQREAIEAVLWIASVTDLTVQKNLLQTKGKIQAEAEWNIPVMEQFLGSRFHSSLTQKISAVEPQTALRVKRVVQH